MTELAEMGRTGSLSSRGTAKSMGFSLRGVALRARSRHVPDFIRAEFPEFPWVRLNRWLSLPEYDFDLPFGVEPTYERLARSFGEFEAPALISVVRKIKERCMEHDDLDGNPRNGVLERHQRGGFVHITMRVPVSGEARVVAALESVLADHPSPTLDGLKAALVGLDGALRELGVAELYVGGSVARGEAGPASDYDMFYRLADKPERAWRVWGELADLLEGELGRVVDLHDIEGYSHPDGEPILVWSV
jgi:predicted nucleotidyltransferase